VTSVSFIFSLPRPGRSRSTAQSSPIAIGMKGFLADLAMRRIWAINAFSAVTTATNISDAQLPMRKIAPPIQECQTSPQLE
jgi:hypothetical protein